MVLTVADIIRVAKTRHLGDEARQKAFAYHRIQAELKISAADAHAMVDAAW